MEGKMKKLLSVLLVLAMLVCFAACGEKEAPKGPGATVTIVKAGEVQVAAEFVEFKDYDQDGKYNIDEVLKAAHEALHPEKDAAYASADLGYGLSVTKLWGEETMSTGYYLNDQMAWSLLDEVKDGDYVAAFVYSDAVGFSDTYAFFDKKNADGKKVDLVLSMLGFDENWAPAVSTLEGAVITVDGKATEIKTDAAGKASVEVSGSGSHVISAVKDGMVLVAPICVVTVK